MNEQAKFSHILILYFALGMLMILQFWLLIEKIDTLKEPIISQVSWQDNISNPDNSEYVIETKFNNNSLTKEELQFRFCLRYYDTLADSSKIWLKQHIK